MDGVLTGHIVKLARIIKRVREAWLIVGIVILLFFFIEGSLSLVFFIKDRTGASIASIDSRSTSDAYSDPVWVRDYYKELHRSYRIHWKPYIYWQRNPFQGEYINIDTNGIRLTAPPKSLWKESRTPMKIFMFGGSTLWGTGARDAFTIPSIVAQELRKNNLDTEVMNFGETGYVSTQEVILLILQLQDGRLPDLVIFYDGVNDTYSTYQQRVAGLPQNEYNRVEDFNLSKPSRFKKRTLMVFCDAANRLSTVRLLKGLLQMVGVCRESVVTQNPLPFGDRASRSDESLARDVIATYKANIEVVKALGEHYHFKCLFYWQPTIFQKLHLTEFEQAQRAKREDVKPFVLRTYELMRQSGLDEYDGYLFSDLSLVFADAREPVYVDWCHPGESGNMIIAKRIARDVLDLIASQDSPFRNAFE